MAPSFDTGLDTGAKSWAWEQAGDGGFTMFDPSLPSNAYHVFPQPTGTQFPVFAQSTDGGVSWNSTAPTNSIKSAMTGAKDPGTIQSPPLVATGPTGPGAYTAGHYFYGSFAVGGVPGIVSWLQVGTQDLTGGCTDGSCAVQDIAVNPNKPSSIYTLSTQTPSAPFKVFHSTDGGGTWTDITPSLPGITQPTGITVSSSQLFGEAVYLTLSGFTAATGGHHIYKGSVGSSVTWSADDGNLPDVPVLRLLVDSGGSLGKDLLAGTDTGVYSSTDGGTTWASFGQGIVPPAPVPDIEQNAEREIIIGTHGRGAYGLPPPVAFRDVLTSEQCESGAGNCNPVITYPAKTVIGDTLIAFILSGGNHAKSDLTPPSGWQLISGANYADNSSQHGVTAWAAQHYVTSIPPTGSGDTFQIANSSLDEAFTMTAAYSGVSATTSASGSVFNSNTVQTTYTAPVVSGGPGDGIVQWFINLAYKNAPDGRTAENYEDKFGYFNVWSTPSGANLRYDPGRDDQLLTDVLTTADGFYGSWTATASSSAPPGAPSPPPPIGNGFAWTVVLPPAI